MRINIKNTTTMSIVKHRPQASPSRSFGGQLVSPFDELVNGFFGRDIAQFMGGDDLQRTAPSVNISERKDGFKLDLLAPGFTKEDMKLNVEDDVLTISAEKKHESLEENERWTRREYALNAFKRSFRLPENTKHEQIKAEFNNGVLSVNIPKAEPSKPATRQISIN